MGVKHRYYCVCFKYKNSPLLTTDKVFKADNKNNNAVL